MPSRILLKHLKKRSAALNKNQTSSTTTTTTTKKPKINKKRKRSKKTGDKLRKMKEQKVDLEANVKQNLTLLLRNDTSSYVVSSSFDEQ